MKRALALFAFAVLLATSFAFADKKKEDDEQFSELKFVVVKEETGKPVRNASVILHAVNKDGKQERGGMQLKTDKEGRTSYNGVPYGKLRVQVLASGLQTYGEDFEISQPSQELVIKLKPPQPQYSIYDNNNNKK